MSRNYHSRRNIGQPGSKEGRINVKLFIHHSNYLKSRCSSLRLAVQNASAFDGANIPAMNNELKAIEGQIMMQIRAWESWSPLKSLIQHSYMKEQLEKFINQLNSFITTHNIRESADDLGSIQYRDELEMHRVLQETVRDEKEMQALLDEQPSSVVEIMKLIQIQLMKSNLKPQETKVLEASLWQLHQKASMPPPLLHLPQVTFTSLTPVVHGSRHDIHEGMWLDKQKVAVRFLRGMENSPEARDLFAKVVESWRKLAHPNIVPVYGMVISGERLYSVLPWMDNGNVLEYVSKVPNVDRLRLLCEIASGLRYLHDKGVVYGNLHGNNVLITMDGVARLSDFSQSLFPESSHYTWNYYSIRWLAPEVHTQRKATKQSDIWSLGMLCIEIWDRELLLNDKELERRLSEGNYPSRPELIPSELWDVVVRCWAKVPEDRPAVAEIISSLQEIRQFRTQTSSPTISSHHPLERSTSDCSTGGVSHTASSRKSRFSPTSLKRLVIRSPRDISGDTPTSPGTPLSSSSGTGESSKITTRENLDPEKPETTGFTSRITQKFRKSKDQSRVAPNSSIDFILEPLEEVGSGIDWEMGKNDNNNNAVFTEPESWLSHAGTETSSDDDEPLQSSIQTLRNWDQTPDQGSINDMVHIMVDGTFKSPGHVNCREIFLTACVEVTTPGGLFQILSQIFSEQEHAQKSETKVNIQMNVLNVISVWLEEGYFLPDQEVLRQMKTSCEDHARGRQPETLLKKLGGLQREVTKRILYAPTNPVGYGGVNIPQNIDLSAKNLAIGLTCLETENFRRLKPSDFITYLTRRESENIRTFAETAQKINPWIVAIVFDKDDIFERADMIEIFIDTAIECQKRRNFSSAVAIALALHSSPVKDLTETKTALARRSQEKLSSLNDFIHHGGYRDALRTKGKAQERGLGIPWLLNHHPKLEDVLDRYPVMIGKDINFRRYIKFMDRFVEEILRAPPALTDWSSQNLASWVHQELQRVPLFDENDPGMSARVAEVMALEEHDHRNRTVARHRVGLKTS